MVENINSKKTLVGFLPPFNNLGDTLPLVEIAKKYVELGGEAIFFSDGGIYEKLVRDIGYKIVQIRVDISNKLIEGKKEIMNKLHHEELIPEKSWFLMIEHEHRYDVEVVEKTVRAFKKENPILIVTNFFYTPLISAKVANIPLVFLTSGVTIPPYFEAKHASFPDNYENAFTRIVPEFIKNRLFNWYTLRCKLGIKAVNQLAKKYNVQTIKRFLDLFCGDYVLVADSIDFLNLKPTPNFPVENYVGFIRPSRVSDSNEKHIDSEIEQHLKKPGKSILLSLGSSGTKKLFLDILCALNQTDYKVIAIYTKILNEDELPEVNDNILLKKFVPSIKKVHEMTDLAIIHGGRGTVYTAAYAGKPVIGIPMHSEQQNNLDNMVRHGTGIRLSKKYFSGKNLLQAIKDIFDNYDKYLENSQLLKSELPKPQGAENAAKRILEIVKEINT